MVLKFKNTFIPNNVFLKEIIVISLPITLQMLLSNLGNLVDNIMVGSLGTDVVAALGSANQIFFITMLIFFGISGGGQIFISQYKGAKNDEGIMSSFQSMLIIHFSFSIIIYILVNLFSYKLIGFFSSDYTVVDMGVKYLKITSIAYILLAINISFSTGFRAIGKTKIPMFISFSTVITNTILNYLFIFGFDFGFISLSPQGYVGAGYATLISRALEVCITIIVSTVLNTNIKINLHSLLSLKLKYFKQVAKKSAPLTVNEFFWSSGQTILLIIYSQRIADNVASLSISGVFSNFFFVLISSIATAVSIIVGNSLGENKIDTAKEKAFKLIGFSFFISIIVSIMLHSTIFLIPILFKVDANVIVNAQNLLTLIAYASPLYFLNATCFFILRAGGDTKSVLLMDTVYSWTIVLPTAFLLRSILKLSLIQSFALVQLLELIKLVICFKFILSYRWAKNLTK